MKKDILIIGGGPAGMVTALTAKQVYPNRSVCILKSVGDGVIPCAIPYMIQTIDNPDDNRMPDAPLEQAGIDTIVDSATVLDVEQKRIQTTSGQAIDFDRLVLATGLSPSLPPIAGIETPGVFAIEKSLTAMGPLRNRCREARHIVILGGGFIGTEFADEIARHTQTEVHLVEMMPKLLYFAFDDEFCDLIHEQLAATGAHVHLSRRAARINGRERVT